MIAVADRNTRICPRDGATMFVPSLVMPAQAGIQARDMKNYSSHA